VEEGRGQDTARVGGRGHRRSSHPNTFLSLLLFFSRPPPPHWFALPLVPSIRTASASASAVCHPLPPFRLPPPPPHASTRAVCSRTTLAILHPPSARCDQPPHVRKTATRQKCGRGRMAGCPIRARIERAEHARVGSKTHSLFRPTAARAGRDESFDALELSAAVCLAAVCLAVPDGSCEFYRFERRGGAALG